MYHNGEPHIIEGDDIAAVQWADDVTTLPDGRQALSLLLIIDPERGKRYAAGEHPTFFHVTNGVRARLLPIARIPAGDSPDRPSDAPAPAEEAEANAQEAKTVETNEAEDAGDEDGHALTLTVEPKSETSDSKDVDTETEA